MSSTKASGRPAHRPAGGFAAVHARIREFQLKLVGSPAFARHGTPRCQDLLRHTCLHYRFPQYRPPRGMAAAPRGRRSPRRRSRCRWSATTSRPASASPCATRGIACLPDFSIREVAARRAPGQRPRHLLRAPRAILPAWPSGRQVPPSCGLHRLRRATVIATLGWKRAWQGPVKPAADRNKTAAATERLIGTSTLPGRIHDQHRDAGPTTRRPRSTNCPSLPWKPTWTPTCGDRRRLLRDQHRA